MLGFVRRRLPGLKSFNLMRRAYLGCTILVAVRLLSRPRTALPALPTKYASQSGNMQ